MTRGAPRTSSGFSLLEILVAAVVLSAALVIVLDSISSGQSASRRLGRKTAAQDLAADMLARAASGESAHLGREGRTRLDGTEYEWRIEQKPAQAGLLRLRCTVRWRVRGDPLAVRAERLVTAAADGASP